MADEKSAPIDTFNKFLVGASSTHIMIGMPSVRYSHDDALLLAAYLVVMAAPFATHPWEDVLKAVKNT